MIHAARIVLATASVLLAAETANAQFYGGFQQRQGFYFQVRTGPFASYRYAATAFNYWYAPAPIWYGWPGVSIVNNPYWVQPQQPIIINNIVQAPVAPPRGPIIPAEFVPPPAPKAARAPQPPAVVVEPPPLKLQPGRADADRLTEAGGKAFADGQYGRALEHFRRAATITPNEPSAYFLISQALFALGKYADAGEVIVDGMALRADWPAARFNTRELYWKKPAIFDEHLRSLRLAVEAYPNDSDLLFLLGHQLWFDGKRDEAQGFMEKARKLGKAAAARFASN